MPLIPISLKAAASCAYRRVQKSEARTNLFGITHLSAMAGSGALLEGAEGMSVTVAPSRRVTVSGADVTGVELVLESGAGVAAGFPDSEYTEKGVRIAHDRTERSPEMPRRWRRRTLIAGRVRPRMHPDKSHDGKHQTQPDGGTVTCTRSKKASCDAADRQE